MKKFKDQVREVLDKTPLTTFNGVPCVDWKRKIVQSIVDLDHWTPIEEGSPNIADHSRWILLEVEDMPHCPLKYVVMDQESESVKHYEMWSNNKVLRWQEIK